MKNITLVAMVCTILFTFISAVFANPANDFKSGYKNGGLCFYEKENFRGRKFCARTGEKLKSIRGIWNNKFSSVQLDKGLVVYVCQERKFSGKCRFFRRSNADLDGEWSNNISSAHIVLGSSAERIARIHRQNSAASNNDVSDNSEVNTSDADTPKRITANRHYDVERNPAQAQNTDNAEEARDNIPEDSDRDKSDSEDATTTASLDSEKPEVCFYNKRSYRGDELCFETNKALRRLSRDWNDNISSIKVKGNATIKLCADSYLEGDCLSLDKSSDFIGYKWDDRVSSLRIRFRKNLDEESQSFDNTAQNEEADEDDDDETEVCFYKRRKYRGKSICIPAGQTLSRLGPRWDRNITSFEVRGDAKVIIKMCTEPYLSGECETFYRSKRFIGWEWNDKASSLRVRMDRRGTY